MFHCITRMGLPGAPSPSLRWVNFLWKRGGLSLRASLHCRSSSTGSDPFCSCKTYITLNFYFTSGGRLLYILYVCTTHVHVCEQKRSHLAESWIQVCVRRLGGVQMGWREGERRAAAEGLSQGAVQPGGPSTHWKHWLEEKDKDDEVCVRREKKKSLSIFLTLMPHLWCSNWS